MANIIERAFDASQKIIRAIYKGAPNLFTTSDLNRQFENIDYRMERLENSIGIVTDMQWLIDSSTGHLKVMYKWIEIHGCQLVNSDSWITVTLSTAAGHSDFSRFSLWFTMAVVTYADDATHLISGATFADSSTKPAANHVVINNWGLAINGEDIPEGATVVEILTQDASGNIIQHYLPALMDTVGYISHMENRVIQSAQDLVDEAVQTIQETIAGIVGVFTFDGWGANSNNHYAKLVYCAGVWVLSLRLPANSMTAAGVLFSGTVSNIPQVLLDKFPGSLQGAVTDTEVTVYPESVTGSYQITNCAQGHLYFAKAGSALTFTLTCISDNTQPYLAGLNTRVQTVLPLLG